MEECTEGYITPSTSPGTLAFFCGEKKDSRQDLTQIINTAKLLKLSRVFISQRISKCIKYFLQNCNYEGFILSGSDIQEVDWRTDLIIIPGNYEYIMMPYGLASLCPSVHHTPSVFLQKMLKHFLCDDTFIYFFLIAG